MTVNHQIVQPSKRFIRRVAPSVAIAALLATAPLAWGVNGNWASTAASPAAWATASNWQFSAVAGSTTPGVANTDMATFGNSATQKSVLWDNNRTINFINFNNTSGNYALTPAAVGNTLYVYGSNGGAGISMNAASGTNINNSVTGNIVMMVNGGIFTNTSPDPSNTLSIGGTVSAGVTGGFLLGIKGTNTGLNTLSADISNGLATGSGLQLRIQRSGSGGSTWIVSGTNSYTGITAVEQGTFIAGRDALPSTAGAFGTATSTITVGINGGGAGTNALGNAALLAGVGNTGYTIGRNVSVLAMVDSVNNAPLTATLGASNTGGTSNFTGDISLARSVVLQAATGGTVEFKTGTWTTNNNAVTIGSAGNLGTVKITNNLSTTAGLTVAHGKLVVGGTVTAPVTVASGATLGGGGNIVGSVTVNGSISPGNSAGTLSTGSQTWAGGAAYVWEVNQVDNSAVAQPPSLKGTDPGFDFMNITGSLNITATEASPYVIDITGLSGTSAGAVSGFDSNGNYTWTLATASGGISGFDPAKFSLLTSHFTDHNATNGTFSLGTSGNDLLLTYAAVAVPEPVTGTLALAVGALLVRRRR